MRSAIDVGEKWFCCVVKKGETYQYPIKYSAATVVFFVYPATLLLINDKNATNGAGDA